jgi:hypothetical protein
MEDRMLKISKVEARLVACESWGSDWLRVRDGKQSLPGLVFTTTTPTTCKSHIIPTVRRTIMPQTEEAAAWFAAVYQAVQEIPHGKVTSYGHIATLIGYRKLSL